MATRPLTEAEAASLVDKIQRAVSVVRWDYFVTLTYQGVVPCGSRRMAGALAWVRSVYRSFGVPASEQLWIGRLEKGRLGRFHWHFLLVLPPRRSVRFVLKALARGLREPYGFGFVDVRGVSTAESAVDYVLKTGSREWADAYEAGRFAPGSGGRPEVIRSRALEHRALGRHDVRAFRFRAAVPLPSCDRVRKQGPVPRGCDLGHPHEFPRITY